MNSIKRGRWSSCNGIFECDWIDFFFSLFFVWVGTNSFLRFEVFYLASFPVCSKSSSTFHFSVLENCRTQPCPGKERTFQGQGEAAHFGFPECFVQVLARCWRGGRMGLGLWNPQIPPPALLRTCREPSTAHSTPSIPSPVAGDGLSIFLGNKARSFIPDIGRCFSQRNSLSLQCDSAAAGVAQGSLFPSLAPQVPTWENWEKTGNSSHWTKVLCVSHCFWIFSEQTLGEQESFVLFC